MPHVQEKPFILMIFIIPFWYIDNNALILLNYWNSVLTNLIRSYLYV